MDGLLVEVTEKPLGSQAVAVAAAGATEVVVDDITDFPDEGGVIDILGARYDYTAVVPAAPILDASGDIAGGGTLVLASPVTVQVDEDDPVHLVVGTQVSTEAVAVIDIPAGDAGNTPDGGDTVNITLDYTQRLAFPIGIYDPALPVVVADDLSAIVGVPGSRPTLDGSMIDPETLPDPVATEPPEVSPSLIVKGTADGLVVKAVETIAPTTVLTYHITATPPVDGSGNPLDFTPDATNQVGDPTRATVVLITELADGSRLVPGTTYYLRAVASNSVDAAPPGLQATGVLDPSVVTDLVTGTITAGFALLGSIQVGQITIHPDTGITIPGPSGTTHFPSDGSPATFEGSVHTGDLAVDGGLTLNGETNKINGTLALTNVVTPPSAAPALTHTWDYQPPIGTDTWSLAEGVNTSEWVSVNTATNTFKRFSKATGAQVASYGPYSGWKLWGAVAIGSTFYLVAAKTTSPIDVYVLRVSSTGALQSSFKVASDSEVTGIPAIGKNLSGHIMVAWSHADATHIHVRTYTTAGVLQTGLLYDYTTGSGITGASNIAVNGVGEAPVGAAGTVNRIWISASNWGAPMLFDSARVWYFWPAHPESCKGVTYTADGRFVQLAYSTYRIYEYAVNAIWPAPVTLGYTWFDSDAAGSGQHETTLSPTASYQPYTWSKLQVSTPAPADNGNSDDPDSIRVYIDGHRQADLAPGATVAKYSTVDTGGAAPPATNGFATATAYPGVIRSASEDGSGPLLEMLGNGSGRWGGLTVDALGKTVLNGDSGWIAVTSFGIGWENYGTPWAAAAYRKVGSRVFLRGLVRSGPVTTPIFNLAEGYRPPFGVIAPVVVNIVTEAATGDGAKTLQTTGTNNGSTPAHTHDVTVTAYDIQVAVSNIGARLTIEPDGDVIVQDTNVNTGFVSLDGVSFFVD